MWEIREIIEKLDLFPPGFGLHRDYILEVPLNKY